MATDVSGDRRPGVGDHATGRPDVARRTLAVAAVGTAIGATEAVLAVSFAALLFAGPLPRLVPTGVGMALFGAAALLLVTGLWATVPGTIGSVQDAPVAILAIVVAGVAAEVGTVAAVPTVLATIVLASFGVGVTFFTLGVLRLGSLVRYVPYPVIGGFLAGSGWLILRGAVSFLADGDGGSSLTGHVVHVATSPMAGVSLGLALLLMVGVDRWGAAVALPAVVIGAVTVFHVVVALGPATLSSAEQGGWLLTGVPEGRLWPPAELGSAAAIDWGAVLGGLPGVISLLAVGTLSLLLNASGIEVSARRDVDFDRELRNAGIANVVASAGGGLPGYQAVSLTVMAHGSGLFRRSVAVVAAAVVVAVMLLGGGVVALVPRPVLGAVLLFLGLGFLREWLVQGRTGMERGEYAVVVLITVVIGVVGVIEGVAVGLVATLVLFAVTYSAMDVVRHRMTLADCRSTVDRPPAQSRRLDAQGEEVVVLELQGFLFFGTACQVLDRVRAELAESTRVRLLVIDLQRVAGLDSSSVFAFAKISQLADQADVELVLSGASDEQEALLRGQDGFDTRVHVVEDLDRAIQWCEEHVLAGGLGPGGRASPQDLLATSLGSPDLATRLLTHVEHVAVRDGDRLISEGVASRDMFVLVAGVVTASIQTRDGGAVRLRTMLPGTVVGEVAMYRGATRTASVVAEGDAAVLRLPAATLERLEDEDPQLAAALHRWLASQLAERLTRSLSTIAALQA